MSKPMKQPKRTEPKRVTEAHTTCWLTPNECGIVWPEAQREPNQKHVEKIATEFDPYALGIPVVAEKNGHPCYHTIDGWHRLSALRLMGYGDQLVQVEVVKCDNAKEAARLFRERNMRRAVTALESFRNGVTEGHPLYVEINNVVQHSGFRIAVSDHPRAIGSIGAIKEIHNKFGAETLGQTLQTIAETWPDDQDAVNAIILRGVGYLIGEYGPAVDLRRFREKLSKKSPSNLIGSCRSQKNVLGSNQTVASVFVLVSQYNAGLRKESEKLPLKTD